MSTTEPLLSPPVVQQDLFSLILERRGWNATTLLALNDPSHPQLQNVGEALEVLETIRQRQTKIVVLPDFDMDGITSGSLGLAGLAELGFNVALHIPDYTRGHDLFPDDIAELQAAHPDAGAIITCDAGINSWAGIEAAKSAGLLTIVTDHHLELNPGSNAHIAINPHRIEETYPHPGICGAHVLYQVLEAYTAAYQPEKMIAIRRLRLFAGIGTVSDMMPLTYENREMVREAVSIARLLFVPAPVNSAGEPVVLTQLQIDVAHNDPTFLHTTVPIHNSLMMAIINSEHHHPTYRAVMEGFAIVLATLVQPQELVDLLDETGAPTITKPSLRSVDDLNEEFFGFYLAPVFNAVRRIEGSMAEAFGVFTATSHVLKLRNMRSLLANNARRRLSTTTLLEEVNDPALQPFAPYVYLSSGPLGMLGLLAASLTNNVTHQPVVVLAVDPRDPDLLNKTGHAGGSARAPGWYDVIDELQAFGFTAIGHQQACGVRASIETIPELAQALATSAQRRYDEVSQGGTVSVEPGCDLRLGATADCDADFTDTDRLISLVRRIALLAPFGMDFPRPTVEMVLDLTQCDISTIGSESQHLRITTQQGLSLLWWGAAEDRRLDLLERQESLDPADRELRLKTKLQVNTYNGVERVQAIIDNILN